MTKLLSYYKTKFLHKTLKKLIIVALYFQMAFRMWCLNCRDIRWNGCFRKTKN